MSEFHSGRTEVVSAQREQLETRAMAAEVKRYNISESTEGLSGAMTDIDYHSQTSSANYAQARSCI